MQPNPQALVERIKNGERFKTTLECLFDEYEATRNHGHPLPPYHHFWDIDLDCMAQTILKTILAHAQSREACRILLNDSSRIMRPSYEPSVIQLMSNANKAIEREIVKLKRLIERDISTQPA